MAAYDHVEKPLVALTTEKAAERDIVKRKRALLRVELASSKSSEDYRADYIAWRATAMRKWFPKVKNASDYAAAVDDLTVDTLNQCYGELKPHGAPWFRVERVRLYYTRD